MAYHSQINFEMAHGQYAYLTTLQQASRLRLQARHGMQSSSSKWATHWRKTSCGEPGTYGRIWHGYRASKNNCSLELKPLLFSVCHCHMVYYVSTLELCYYNIQVLLDVQLRSESRLEVQTYTEHRLCEAFTLCS